MNPSWTWIVFFPLDCNSRPPFDCHVNGSFFLLSWLLNKLLHLRPGSGRIPDGRGRGRGRCRSSILTLHFISVKIFPTLPASVCGPAWVSFDLLMSFSCKLHYPQDSRFVRHSRLHNKWQCISQIAGIWDNRSYVYLSFLVLTTSVKGTCMVNTSWFSYASFCLYIYISLLPYLQAENGERNKVNKIRFNSRVNLRKRQLQAAYKRTAHGNELKQS